MLNSLHLANAVSAVAEFHWLVVGTEVKVATHARGEIDDDVDIAAAYAFHHFGIEIHPAAGFATIGFPDMYVGNCSAGSCRLNCCIRNFFWCDGNFGMPANRIPRTGHCAANDDIAIHSCMLQKYYT